MSAIEQLAEIEARANAATGGPWTTGPGRGVVAEVGAANAPAYTQDPENVAYYGGVLIAETITATNAEFVAAARDDVPRLAAAARGVLALHSPDWREWCQHCRTPAPCPTVRAITSALGSTP